MLKRVLVTFVAACTLSATSLAFAAEQTHVKFTTTAGDFEIALDNEKAPQTVENFKQYVTDKFYDDTTFHRVIPGFMVQGGGFTADMNQKQTRPPVKK
ncbi:Peptidyl-prolyl cis-trans isomerase A precursor [Morganella morganii]|nr:Peptidyl-prolyl cis-trans isomerase A precursor [Morganella morganii]